MIDLHTADDRFVCRRCGGHIQEGDEYARGAVGYGYLCRECCEALGLLEDA